MVGDYDRASRASGLGEAIEDDQLRPLALGPAVRLRDNALLVTCRLFALRIPSTVKGIIS